MKRHCNVHGPGLSSNRHAISEMTSWFSSNRPAQANLSPPIERALAGSPDSLAESTNTSVTGRAASHTDASPALAPQPLSLFDPFSGGLLGEILPPPLSEAREANEEELWRHLTQIMTLQSNISDMHAKMEGIGTRKQPTPGRPQQKQQQQPSVVRRRPSDIANPDSGVEDGGDDEADEEAEENRRRDEEFSRLGTRFHGRTEAINEIWTSVSETFSPERHHFDIGIDIAAG